MKNTIRKIGLLTKNYIYRGKFYVIFQQINCHLSNIKMALHYYWIVQCISTNTKTPPIVLRYFRINQNIMLCKEMINGGINGFITKTFNSIKEHISLLCRSTDYNQFAKLKKFF